MSNEINNLSDIESGLAAAANGIDVGNSDDMLVSVRETVGKRRRRRNGVLGVAAAGALLVSGVTIANITGGDSDDRLISAPATEPDDESNDDQADEPSASAPSTTALAVPDSNATGVAPIEVSVVPSAGTVVSDDAFGVDQGSAQVLPWQGGFLSIRQEYQPQALPTDLPAEITEQFSQEVVDLFADGLPATIDEAIEMLNEAGLYDEVSDIVVNNPGVSEAIYGGPTEAPEISARFSADGVEWSDIDVAFPNEFVQIWNMSSTGDRVVAALDAVPPVDGDENWRPESFSIIWSDDLVNWTTQSFPAPRGAADLADYERFEAYPSQIVATSDAWMLALETHISIDVMSLIDPELRAELEGNGAGYGSSTDDDGVVLYLDNGPDGEEETIRFTWEELGVDSPSPMFEQGQLYTVTSDWASEPLVQVGDSRNRGFVVALDNGFASSDYEAGVSISNDGVNWTTFPAPNGGFVESIMPVGDTVVAFAGGVAPGERVQYLLDSATGEWTQLEIAGLPEQFSVGSSSTGAAILYEYSDDFQAGGFPEPGSTILSAEVDGYRFELQVTFSEASVTGTYTLTDIESGEVVSTETLELAGNNESDDFEFAKEVYDINGNQEGFRVFDPESGDELIAVAFEDMDEQQFDSDGNPIEGSILTSGVEVSEATSGVEIVEATTPVTTTLVGDGEAPSPNDEPDFVQPTQWLLATDGTTWLVESLPESSPEFGGYGDVALVDGVALVASYDGSFLRYELG